jgi:uncharacterized protein YcbK (DUF882 family)
MHFPNISRRVVQTLVFILLVLPNLAFADQAAAPVEKSLSFYHLHTDEHLPETVFWRNGAYVNEGISVINRFLGDFRTGEVVDMDPSLLDLLYDLRVKAGSAKPFHIISAYRSPKTNQRLAAKGRAVATRSLHMEGKAIDVRLPDVDIHALRETAIAMQRGGVGFYQRTGFIHVDTGRVRQW